MGDTMDALCGFGFFADLECRLKGWVFLCRFFQVSPNGDISLKKMGNRVMQSFQFLPHVFIMPAGRKLLLKIKRLR
jgi:hypothetical protein